MKTRSARSVVVAGLAISLLAVPIAVQSETKQQDQAEKLEELLKERQATLQKLVEVVTVEYRNGTTRFDTVVRATDQLLDAELELANNAEARTAILRRRVELMESLLAMVDARFKAAQASQAQLLAAQAELLESQIQLAREQAGGDGRER